MSIYRSFLAVVAAITIASPVFADDNAMPASSEAAPVAATETSSVEQSIATKQSAPTAEVKVNVNKVSAKELLKVKGINAAKARAIVTYRKKHGEFKSLDELANVKALSKLKAADLKTIQDQLSLS